MKKNMIVAIACAAALLALVGSQTLANDTASFTTTNVITTGNVDMEIYETTVAAIDETDIEDYTIITNNGDGTYEVAYGEFFANNAAEILPGDTVSKIVTLENVGSEPFYARVKLEVSGMAEDDVTGLVFDMDTNDWKADTDGFVKAADSDVWSCYYYYSEEVTADEEFIFFENVKFPTSMDNHYLDEGNDIDIKITGEAVQSKNTMQSHLDGMGWENTDMITQEGE